MGPWAEGPSAQITHPGSLAWGGPMGADITPVGHPGKNDYVTYFVCRFFASDHFAK